MKTRRRALRLLAAIVLLFGIAAGLRAWLLPGFPRIALNDGGEFRVLQARYAKQGTALALERTPKWKSRLWDVLPKPLKSLMSPLEGQLRSLIVDDSAVSIWGIWNSPQKHAVHFSEIEQVEVTPNEGSAFSTISYVDGHVYQEILIVDPPRDSCDLRLKVLAPWQGENPGRLEFTINNPAYRQP